MAYDENHLARRVSHEGAWWQVLFFLHSNGTNVGPINKKTTKQQQQQHNKTKKQQPKNPKNPTTQQQQKTTITTTRDKSKN